MLGTDVILQRHFICESLTASDAVPDRLAGFRPETLAIAYVGLSTDPTLDLVMNRSDVSIAVVASSKDLIATSKCAWIFVRLAYHNRCVILVIEVDMLLQLSLGPEGVCRE